MGMKLFARMFAIGVAGLALSSCGDSDSNKAANTTPEATGKSAAAPAPVKMMESKAGFTADQKKTIEELVRETLIKRPEILQEAFTVLEKREREEQEKRKLSALSESAEVLFRSKLSPTGGDPKGDVTIVEFFDYNCPYCGKAFIDLEKVMNEDKKLKVVFKEYPIFGGASVVAAKAALAARKQGKYFEFHKAMLVEKSRKTESSIFRMAKEVGLDVEQLKKDMNDKEVAQSIAETKLLADRLGIRGTPAFFVGDKLIPGAPQNLKDLLREHAQDIRTNGCKNC